MYVLLNLENAKQKGLIEPFGSFRIKLLSGFPVILVSLKTSMQILFPA